MLISGVSCRQEDGEMARMVQRLLIRAIAQMSFTDLSVELYDNPFSPSFLCVNHSVFSSHIKVPVSFRNEDGVKKVDCNSDRND